MVDAANPGVAVPLDARDLVPPFTLAPLRGSSHVHVFNAEGSLVSFTYDDQYLSRFSEPGIDHDISLRNVGVSVVGKPVAVPKSHPRNHDGSAFSVLVTRTTANPTPGGDDYRKAYEEGWIGVRGYQQADGSWRRHALAFLGDVVNADGRPATEVFVADLPDDLSQPGDGPLAGTETRLPSPPTGVMIRRLTRTADRRYPGVQGVRHWVRSSPDGAQLAVLMRDNAGVAQLNLVSTRDGALRQLTHHATDVASAFTWSPDGRYIAYINGGCVCRAEVASARRIV